MAWRALVGAAGSSLCASRRGLRLRLRQPGAGAGAGAEGLLRLCTSSSPPRKPPAPALQETRKLPSSWWDPYWRLGRLDKPTGALLLMWPCWWGVALATPVHSLPDPSLLALFGAGALAMRTAGCVINDMWDKDFDKRVSRTKLRPLASGELSLAQASAFLGCNLAAGLAVLLSLNSECWLMSFASMPIVVAYPLMKRFTWWPQAVLGTAMNWGALVGWTAVNGSLSLAPVIPLYAGGFFWTLVYDTLYGHQDKLDDKKLGLKSTSLLFGAETKSILYGFTAASVGCLAAAGLAADLSYPFFAGLTGGGAHLAYQVHRAQLDDPLQLFDVFKSSQLYGGIIGASIVLGHFG